MFKRADGTEESYWKHMADLHEFCWLCILRFLFLFLVLSFLFSLLVFPILSFKKDEVVFLGA